MAKNDEKQLICDFLQSHPLMTLVTMSASGTPQTAEVHTLFENDCSCHFISKASTRKYENIKGNSSVVLAAPDEETLQFCEYIGTATVIVDTIEAAQVLPKLQELLENRRSGYWLPPVTQLEGGQYVIFKVTPKSCTLTAYGTDRVHAQPERYTVTW